MILNWSQDDPKRCQWYCQWLESVIFNTCVVFKIWFDCLTYGSPEASYREFHSRKMLWYRVGLLEVFLGSFALRLCWKLPGSSWKLLAASWGFLEVPGVSWKSFSGHLGCSWSAPGGSKRLPKVSQRVEPDLVRSELWRAILYAFLSHGITLGLWESSERAVWWANTVHMHQNKDRDPGSGPREEAILPPVTRSAPIVLN